MTVDAIVENIRDFLEREGFHYDFDEEILRFDIGFAIDGPIKSINCMIAADIDGDGCTAIGWPNIGIDKNNERELESLLFRINSNLLNGIWQIVDNEVRYTKWISLEGDAVLTDEMLSQCIYGIGHTIKKYCPSILAVNINCSTADEEIRKLYGSEENDSDEESEDDPDKETPEDPPNYSTNKFDNGYIFWMNDDSKKDGE